tara:strand:+ start:2175 stop:2417 length:243 start_codon:yes stop_codon:yes gene_type:complete
MKLEWGDPDYDEIKALVDQIGDVLTGQRIHIVGLALVEHLCLLCNFSRGSTMDPDKMKALLLEKRESGWNIDVIMKGEEN